MTMDSLDRTTPVEMETQVLQRLIQWGEQQEPVRAAILTSSRANPGTPVDVFSDYDIIFVVTDIVPYWQEREWLEDFGPVLVTYRNPIHPDPDYGFDTFAWIVQYENGLKIDFCFEPVELLRAFIEKPEQAADMGPDMDLGHRILLDKDGITLGMKPPSHRAFIPSPPSHEVYAQAIEEFFHEATYVAKHLWRGDFFPAKFQLDHLMKYRWLRKMLEWQVEIEHSWSLRLGAHGKRLQQYLSPELWSEVEATYAGAGIEENWNALFSTMALFKKVAVQVGDGLGYDYLDDMDRRTVAYIRKVRELDPQAELFA